MEPPERCSRCNAFLSAGALSCSNCRTSIVTDLRPPFVTSISRQLNNLEPLLHTLARMGKVPLYYYPRPPNATPALRLDFSDNSVQGASLLLQRITQNSERFAVLPPTVSHELTLTCGNLRINLRGYSSINPAYGEDEAALIHCKGYIAFNRVQLPVAVYREKPLAPVQLRSVITVRLFNPLLTELVYTVDGEHWIPVTQHARFQWDPAKLFILRYLDGDQRISVDPPDSNELWIEVVADGVEYLHGSSAHTARPKKHEIAPTNQNVLKDKHGKPIRSGDIVNYRGRSWSVVLAADSPDSRFSLHPLDGSARLNFGSITEWTTNEMEVLTPQMLDKLKAF